MQAASACKIAEIPASDHLEAWAEEVVEGIQRREPQEFMLLFIRTTCSYDI